MNPIDLAGFEVNKQAGAEPYPSNSYLKMWGGWMGKQNKRQVESEVTELKENNFPPSFSNNTLSTIKRHERLLSISLPGIIYFTLRKAWLVGEVRCSTRSSHVFYLTHNFSLLQVALRIELVQMCLQVHWSFDGSNIYTHLYLAAP